MVRIRLWFFGSFILRQNKERRIHNQIATPSWLRMDCWLCQQRSLSACMTKEWPALLHSVQHEKVWIQIFDSMGSLVPNSHSGVFVAHKIGLQQKQLTQIGIFCCCFETRITLGSQSVPSSQFYEIQTMHKVANLLFVACSCCAFGVPSDKWYYS